MKKSLEEIDFYFITDSTLTKRGILSDVKEAVDAGCRIVQYREKNKTAPEMAAEAYEIKSICKDKAIFIVNDSIPVTLTADADGVHLGQEDVAPDIARRLVGKDRIIGVTVHNLKEAIDAERGGADYLGVSPIYSTSTKSDAGDACGPETISEIRRKVGIPLVAIGGINKDNTPETIKAGADSVVAISAVLNSGDVGREVSEFIRIIKENKKKRSF